MARAVGVPFRRLPQPLPDCEWYYQDSQGHFRDLPSSLNDWDADASVSVTLRIRISREVVEAETGVQPHHDVRLTLSWYCRTTQIRGTGDIVSLTTRDAEDAYQLSCIAPGDQLGGEVEFRAAMVLASTNRPHQPLTASIAGSVLWQAREVISIEGSGGRFPMVWVDFERASGLPGQAGWYLEWDPYALEEDVLRGPRLYLNKAHARLRDAIEDPTTEASRNIFEMLYFEVGRTLIAGALHNEEFIRAPERYGSGSLGATVCRLISGTFPGVPPAHLADRMRKEPIRFERELQHGLRVLEALG